LIAGLTGIDCKLTRRHQQWLRSVITLIVIMNI